MISIYIWYVFFCKGGYEFTFVFDLSSECGWLWIYICIWFGFRMWLVVNLWTNLTSCFQMGSVRIFLRHKMPETNKDCDSSSSQYFILYSEKISDQRRRNKPCSSLFPITKCQRPLKIEISFPVNILDAGQICLSLFWRNIVVGSGMVWKTFSPSVPKLWANQAQETVSHQLFLSLQNGKNHSFQIE